MASRDTIIEVIDHLTGYKARIKVPLDIIEMARLSEAKPNGQPINRVQKARDAVCIQVRAAMAKQGRSAGWLAWQDIAGSISIVAKLEPAEQQPASTRRLRLVTTEPDLESEQGSLF